MWFLENSGKSSWRWRADPSVKASPASKSKILQRRHRRDTNKISGAKKTAKTNGEKCQGTTAAAWPQSKDSVGTISQAAGLRVTPVASLGAEPCSTMTES